MGLHDPERPDGWTADDVRVRSEIIPLAIATRAAFYPEEVPFQYAMAGPGQLRAECWSAEERARALAQPMLAT